jgi:hypothetical protein
MARTARNLITDSLRILGVVGQDATPNNSQISIGLTELHNVVAQLELDNLYPYTDIVTKGTLVTGQTSYSVGTGANIDINRPNRIKTLALNFGGIYRPLKQESTLTFDDEARFSSVSTVPSLFIYRTDFPNGTLEIYPKPSQNFEYTMTSQVKMLEYGLNDEILLPSGYYPLIMFSLAEQLGIHFPNPAKYPMIKAKADKILWQIKSLNNKSAQLKNDYGGRRGRGNIFTYTNEV